jgi:hypothetical protein
MQFLRDAGGQFGVGGGKVGGEKAGGLNSGGKVAQRVTCRERGAN